MESSSGNKSMTILFGSIFLVGMGFSIIMPVLPYYAEALGANGFQLGLLITVYAVCQFIFAPIWGAYSDRVGRKPLLLIGISGYAFTFLLFGFATELWMLYLIRAVGGSLSCATLPTAMAYVADSTSLDKRGGAMGMIGAAMGMGMVFGPAVGGLMSQISLAFPFVFAGILGLINTVAIWLLLKESLPLENRVNKQVKIERASLLEGLRSPLVVFFLVILAVSIGESIHHATYALFTQAKLSFGAHDIGWSFTAAGITSALVQGLLVGRMITRVGEERTATIGITLLGISLALFIFTYDIASSIIFMVVFSTGIGLTRPSISAAVSKRTLSAQGSAMGILQGYDSLGRAIGPALGGWMLDQGLNYGYYSGIMVVLIGLITLVAGSSLRQTDSITARREIS
ncbi:MAG TPA: MFS transporter [Syntrophomonadaceae bacterium]|jgi:multidrug resistance protein|nr:MFS transporter [Syntrophomonadaceae bacterium]